LVQSSPRPDLPLGERLQQDLKNDLIAGLLVVIPLAMQHYQLLERNPADPLSWGKVGRNEACPCGSGKKYKHCHGRFA
jgi:uncharacterized protein YecA (UPF0149 family)